MIIQLENPAFGKYLFNLNCMSLTVSLSIQPFTSSTVIKYGFITMPSDKLFMALLSGHIQTVQIIICKLYFFSIPSIEKTGHKTTKLLLANFAQQVLLGRC